MRYWGKGGRQNEGLGRLENERERVGWEQKIGGRQVMQRGSYEWMKIISVYIHFYKGNHCDPISVFCR